MIAEFKIILYVISVYVVNSNIFLLFSSLSDTINDL